MRFTDAVCAAPDVQMRPGKLEDQLAKRGSADTAYGAERLPAVWRSPL